MSLNRLPFDLRDQKLRDDANYWQTQHKAANRD
jgi:hypothetical protein